jgi:cell division protease FtsH
LFLELWVPEEEKYLQNKDELMARLVTLVAGRAAEEIVFGRVTTGAANDIEKATKIAKAMITQYGMSDRFGLMNLATVDDPYLNGNARLDCSDETAAQIDEEVKNMLKECYEEAKQLLTENRDVLDKIAHYLYDHETITGKEFMKIFREVKGLPEPTDTTGFTHSEKVAESVTFNEDGSYSSTLNGPSETDIWKGIGDVNTEKDDSYSIGESSQGEDSSNADHQSADAVDKSGE